MKDFSFSAQEAANAPACDRTGKKLTLCFGIGRSGQRWLTRLFDAHDSCSGGCERHPEAEPFIRYTAWNQLPIDSSGYERLLWQSIYWDWQRATHSFCASPYWCFNAVELVKKMNPDSVIWILRDPDATVSSLTNKGWYRENPTHDPENGIPGLQPEHWQFPYRSFGRIFPKDPETQAEWEQMHPVERVAWFTEVASCALEQAWSTLENAVPRSLRIRLDDLDQNYKTYKTLADWSELDPRLKKREFKGLKGKMSNQSFGKRRGTDPHPLPPEIREKVRARTPSYRRIYEAITPLNDR